MKPSPIALFVYNRPEHTRKTVAALQKNLHAGESELFIFSDGPKDAAAREAVGAVRAYVKTITGFKRIEIAEREENWGLSRSIVSGVTDIVNRFGSVIVVEDDLVTSPHFLEYMNDALETYADDEQVISIHGYTYPVKKPLPETFFLRGADCWGWATWKRGWDLFEPDGKKLLAELEGRHLASAFDLDGAYPFTDTLKRQIAGQNDSWAIRWHASAFLAGKLTLYPGHSLVKNIGFDGTGTHGGNAALYATDLWQKRIPVSKIPSQENIRARTGFKEYFNSLKPSVAARVLRKSSKILHRARREAPVLLPVLLKGVLSLGRSVQPKSRKFGLDRGGSIDRYYIDKFIREHRSDIRGVVLEIADSRYSKKYGADVERFEVLHFAGDNATATIVGDLTQESTLPENIADCFICTQTFNFIYDVPAAVRGAHRLLKPNGVLLATVAGISQVSRYDMDRWGDYWRFTALSCRRMFEEVFGSAQVTVDYFGNSLSARAFLNGQSSRELTKRELDCKDDDYQMLITIRARKRAE